MIVLLCEDVAGLGGDAHLKGRHGVLVERYAIRANSLGRRGKPKARGRHGDADVYGPPAVAGRVVRAPQPIHVERAVVVRGLIDVGAVAVPQPRLMAVDVAQLARGDQFGPTRYRQEHVVASGKIHGLDALGVDVHDDPRGVAFFPRQPGPADLPQRYSRFRRGAQCQRDQCNAVHRCAYHHALQVERHSI